MDERRDISGGIIPTKNPFPTLYVVYVSNAILVNP